MISNIRQLVKSNQGHEEEYGFAGEAGPILIEVEKQIEECLWLLFWFNVDPNTHPCICHAIDEVVRRLAGDKYDEFVKRFNATTGVINWQSLDDKAKAMIKEETQRLRL